MKLAKSVWVEIRASYIAYRKLLKGQYSDEKLTLYDGSKVNAVEWNAKLLDRYLKVGFLKEFKALQANGQAREFSNERYQYSYAKVKEMDQKLQLGTMSDEKRQSKLSEIFE